MIARHYTNNVRTLTVKKNPNGLNLKYAQVYSAAHEMALYICLFEYLCPYLYSCFQNNVPLLLIFA